MTTNGHSTYWRQMTVCAVCALAWFAGWVATGIAAGTNPDTSEKTPAVSTQAEKAVIHIYFAAKDNSFLQAEERVIVSYSNAADLGRRIIEALIQGPRSDLMRTIPAGTNLRAFFLTPGGTAYVDLTEAVTENHPGGTQLEMMTVYSIVNSLILNIPEIESVKILIAGQEAQTVAGHVDIRFPFKADMLLIR
jgi:spore germination protein GerM